ncbi:unnamed protein product [Brassica oleracea]
MDSSPSARVMKQYQVFLSFRGEDTRKTIVSHLHKALFDRGIDTFKDDKRLEIGDSISDEIKEAIHNSKIAVVVISENYASSTWCLNELQMIMELHKKQKLTAVPIFYEVTPSDVRHQRKTFSLERYKSARNIRFFTRKKTVKAKKILEWKEALTEIAGISGTVSRTCVEEAVMIDDIARRISRQLFAVEPIDFGDIVGMNAHMKRLSPLLKLESTDDVQMIGIWGMGGVGKTTIAKFLYRDYSYQFAPHRCFIENVRNGNLLDLQEKLLSSIVGEENEKLWSVEQGCGLIKSRLGNRKVFLVVDDVDNLDQLNALAKKTNWFGPGSRIIVTTRDKGLFCSGSSGGVSCLYHVDILDKDNVIQVLKQFAFEGGQAPSDVYEGLAIQASSLAQGLPSALEVFGRYLRRMNSIDEWEKALGRLEKIPQKRIKEILRTSYMGLDWRHKAVFLHVACLFNGNSVQSVKALLEDGDYQIRGLAEKSLIDISADDYITMHVLIEQVGKEIAREELASCRTEQPVYWEHEKIIHLLQNNADTHSVQSLALHMCEMPQVLYVEGRVFYAGSIKFLKVFRHMNHTESKLQFIPRTEKLPQNVLLLHWDGYPLTTLPPYERLRNIVEINLRHSKLERLWNKNLRLDKLRRLDVSCSSNLKEPPNLSMAINLEELLMEGCTRLERLPKSIGSLYRLNTLNLSHCDVLANLEIHISEQPVPLGSSLQIRKITLHLDGETDKLSSLANLSIEGRINIELTDLIGDAEQISFISKRKIPHEVKLMNFYYFASLNIKRTRYNKEGAPFSCISFSSFPFLAELKLINLNILNIPDDIGQLHSLQKLDLSGNDFENLPTSMKNLSKLKYVRLSNCIKLENLPELTQLQTLKLSGCSNLKSVLILACDRNGLLELDLNNSKNIQLLTDHLRHFTSLIHLDLSRHDFDTIPETITELSSLGTLCLNNCKKLKSVEKLPLSLQHLYAHGCDSLKNVAFSQNHSIKHLDLSHCFSLQQDEQLITRFLNDGYSQEVSQRFLCLPGTRVPSYFDNQSSGTCISLPLMRHTSTIVGFASCVMISCERSFHLQFPVLSYDWKCEDDEVIQMNLKPNLYHASDTEEEETITSHNLVIIHVPSSLNTEIIQELRLESHLQLSDEFRFPPGKIRACGGNWVQT